MENIKMIYNKKIIIFIVLLIFGIGFKYPQKGGILRISFSDNIRTIDPVQILSEDELLIASQIYEPLFKLDNKGNLQSNLVEEWDVDDTGTNIYIKLREDILFHNKQQLTAKDVKYSLERFCNPYISKNKHWGLSAIKGSSEFYNGLANEIKGINIIGKYQIVFNLKYPYKFFLELLSTEFGYVVPYGVKNLNDPSQVIGAGPFMLEKWTDKELNLVRNPYYFRGEPFVSEIKFEKIKDVFDGLLKFELGDFDLYRIPDREFSRLKGDAVWSNNIIEEKKWGITFLGFNLRSRTVSDINLRKGITYAIDKKDIFKRILNSRGNIAKNILPEIMVKHNEDVYNYNILKSRNILLGYDDVQIVLAYPKDNGYLKSIAENIKVQLGAVNINVVLKEYPMKDFLESVRNGLCDMFLFSYRAFVPNQDAFLFPLFHSSGLKNGYNLSGLKDTQIDNYLDALRRGESSVGYKEIEKNINDKFAIVPLFHLNEFWVKQPYVQNLNFTPYSGSVFLKVWVMNNNLKGQ